MAKKVEEELGWKTEIKQGVVGDFEVYVDDELVYSRQDKGAYPNEDALIEQFKAMEKK